MVPTLRHEACFTCGNRIEDPPRAIATAGVAYEGDGGRIVCHVACWHEMLARVAGEVRELARRARAEEEVAGERRGEVRVLVRDARRRGG